MDPEGIATLSGDDAVIQHSAEEQENHSGPLQDPDLLVSAHFPQDDDGDGDDHDDDDQDIVPLEDDMKQPADLLVSPHIQLQMQDSALSSPVVAAAAVAAAAIPESSPMLDDDDDDDVHDDGNDYMVGGVRVELSRKNDQVSSLPPSHDGEASTMVEDKKPAPSTNTSSRQPHVLTDDRGVEKTFGSALGLLTRRFMDVVLASESGTVDMNICAVQLGVPKRRIYDITGVLEGVCMLEKRSKNTVAWKGTEGILGSSIDPDAKERIDKLREEISAVTKEEERLDRWLAHLCKNQVVSQSVNTDDIVEAIFYPAGGEADKLPTKETILDESGKPKCALVAVQAPFSSYAHIVSAPDGGPERQLYVGSQLGLSQFDVAAPVPGSPGRKRQSPFAMTSGKAFKSARTDERGISVFVLPTFFDDKEQKLKTTGIRLLSDDPYTLAAQVASALEKKDADGDEGEPIVPEDGEESEDKRPRSASWDVAESMANDEGVSEFFEGDVV